jgi:alpha-tubulin suppressor-like RCC1 family protein
MTSRLLVPALAVSIMVAAVGCGDATAPEPGPTLHTGQAPALQFRQVSAGRVHTCGVTAGNVAYCWGDNALGRLGDGTLAQRLRPVRVVGGLRFVHVSTGTDHTCGVTTGNVAYCWGDNRFGQLGDGSLAQRLRPVRVSGGFRFRLVSAGQFHTCGVTPDYRAYCWGDNRFGQLADGTLAQRLRPIRVTGGLRFRQVSAGTDHTCGVILGNQAYCWGHNLEGELGDGTTAFARPMPVRVAGGLRFRQVSAGQSAYSCGVTIGQEAYCWGSNNEGQLGDGTWGIARLTPVRVVGGLSFRQVSPGAFHTCSLTPDHQAYCWGNNFTGPLGDGTETNRLTPDRVAGGLRFRQVSAGGTGGFGHSCGVTLGLRAYCWGGNSAGELGDGTTTDRLTPVRVALPSLP